MNDIPLKINNVFLDIVFDHGLRENDRPVICGATLNLFLNS